MAALAEVTWTQPEKKNFESFKARIPALLKLYDAMGYNYAKHLADVSATYTPCVADKSLKARFATLQGRTIRYTLDGTEPTLDSPLYSDEISIKKDAIVRAASFGTSGDKSRTICDTIRVNKASFCNVTLNSRPHENYTFAGAPILVDGIAGNGNYRTGRWLGFIGNDCDATIDLGAVMPVSEVSLNCCIFQCDGVLDAAGIKVSVSKDGKKFETFGEENIAEVDKATEFGVKTHNIASKKAKKARYVNVVVESVKSLPEWHAFAGSQGFVFVDEISVK